jgi:DNA-binding beta-propeller fold protein YncE
LDNPDWASNSTLDQGSDFYVANRGNSTIVRMKTDGTEVAVRRVTFSDSAVPLADGTLNGIATSTDGTTIYVTAAGPGQIGIVLALQAF